MVAESATMSRSTPVALTCNMSSGKEDQAEARKFHIWPNLTIGQNQDYDEQDGRQIGRGNQSDQWQYHRPNTKHEDLNPGMSCLIQ
jgi:hypothetical protein